jgi:hypothetical protein
METARARAVADLKAIFSALRADVDAAAHTASPGEAPGFTRRTFARTLFAYVEGVLYQLGQVAANSGPDLPLFSPQERAALLDQTYQLNEQGELITRSARTSLKARVRFVLTHYPRIHGASLALDLTSSGWSAFNTAIRIRDRLMHPKKPADLDLSSDEMHILIGALEWFEATLLSLFRVCDAADKRFTPEPAA